MEAAGAKDNEILAIMAAMPARQAGLWRERELGSNAAAGSETARVKEKVAAKTKTNMARMPARMMRIRGRRVATRISAPAVIHMKERHTRDTLARVRVDPGPNSPSANGLQATPNKR